MKNDRKSRLIALGVDILADALLKLSDNSEIADDMIDRMLASPVDNIKRFKSKLAGIKRSTRFIHWRESADYARKLEALLADLREGVASPRSGIELLALFYESDDHIFHNCDDSNGIVGDVFRIDARKLFVEYAAECKDKDWIKEILLRLISKDDYGVRDSLFEHAIAYFPEPVIRSMITYLQKQADNESDQYKKRHLFSLIECLARQIKDATLFEQTRIASWGKLSTAAIIDIGRTYFESGDELTALSWLEQIPEQDTFRFGERDRLLLDIHGKLGNHEEQAVVAWRMFRRHHSLDSLESLLAVIGEEQLEIVISQTVNEILNNDRLSLDDASFLIQIDFISEAATYFLDRANQLNGEYYDYLLPLAELMESEQHYLTATILYRALIDSILERGQTKTYPHGVRYLNKLDMLAHFVFDWQSFINHVEYSQRILKSHGRKYSFWSQYEKIK